MNTREDLFNSNLPLSIKVAMSCWEKWNRPMPLEEILAVSHAALWSAAIGFDPKRGFKFSTYAWVACANSCNRYCEEWKKWGRSSMVAADLRCQAMGDDYRFDPPDKFDALREVDIRDSQESIERSIAFLGGRMVEVCRRLMGGESGGQIARDLGISGERVRQLRIAISIRLKHVANKLEAQSA